MLISALALAAITTTGSCDFPSFEDWRALALTLPNCPSETAPNLCQESARAEYLDDVNFVQGVLWAELQHLCINGEISDPELWYELTDEATDVVSSCWDLLQYDNGHCCD